MTSDNLTVEPPAIFNCFSAAIGKSLWLSCRIFGYSRSTITKYPLSESFDSSIISLKVFYTHRKCPTGLCFVIVPTCKLATSRNSPYTDGSVSSTSGTYLLFALMDIFSPILFCPPRITFSQNSSISMSEKSSRFLTLHSRKHSEPSNIDKGISHMFVCARETFRTRPPVTKHRSTNKGWGNRQLSHIRLFSTIVLQILYHSLKL